MPGTIASILTRTTIAAMAAAVPAHAEPAQQPNFTGNYRCEPDPAACSSPTFSVTQSGGNLVIKDDKDVSGNGSVTSNISLSVGAPWNMLGVVLPDNRIQWTNGTVWRKQ